MPIDHQELAFEDAIEHHLLKVAGYIKADPANFDRERRIDPLRRYRSALISAAVTGKIDVRKESA
jgi:hypothetical protein